MYQNILVPFDGSDEAQAGAEHAIGLASSVGATVHVLYVIDLPGAPRTVYVREDEEEMREEYRKYGVDVTSGVCEAAESEGVDCETAIKTGSIHEEVVDYAEENDMDLIVVGTGYRGTLGAILGGKAEKIVRTSTTPVTTVRQQIDD
jgi:nucleotide-binding universal stress UspA family protein